MPADAANFLAIAVSLNGGDSEDDVAVDRQYMRLMEQYMDVTGGEEVTTKGASRRTGYLHCTDTGCYSLFCV